MSTVNRADAGPFHVPADVAKRLHKTTREVQAMCADREIDWIPASSAPQRRRYLISEQAIERWVAKNTVRAIT